MSTILMRAPRETQSPAHQGKTNLSAVDSRDRLASILQQSNGTRICRHPEPDGHLQEVERAGICEILCEMLVTSVWEDGNGSVRK